MKKLIIEKLRNIATEGANARHNGGSPENDKAFDPEYSKNKEKNIKYNYEKLLQQIAKAKEVVKANDINTNPHYPGNGSLYKVVLTSHGRLNTKNVAKLNNDTQEKDPNNQKIGSFEKYGPSNGNMVMFVSAPKRFTQPHDKENGPVVRTSLDSPYEEAFNKALVYFEKDIIEHYQTLFGLDRYVDPDVSKTIGDEPKRGEELKRIKSNFEKLIPHVQYVGNPENKKIKVLKKRLERGLNDIRRYPFHWLDTSELENSHVHNIYAINKLKKSLIKTLEALEVRLKEDKYSLPILLKSLLKQLQSDEGLK